MVHLLKKPLQRIPRVEKHKNEDKEGSGNRRRIIERKRDKKMRNHSEDTIIRRASIITTDKSGGI